MRPARCPPFCQEPAMADYTSEQLLDGIAKALKARDFPAVAALLKMLAVKDPAAAETVYDVITAAAEARRG